MSPPAFDAAYGEDSAVLTPTAVSQYLAVTRPWELERHDQVKEIWLLPDAGGVPRARIMARGAWEATLTSMPASCGEASVDLRAGCL
jgi:hypothetical protein